MSSADDPSSVVGPPSSVARAAALLKAGELVAFPTDTVYGVGAIVWDAAAVGKLYAAKLRALDKAIPVLLADPADVTLVARDLPPAALRIAAAFLARPAHPRRAKSRACAR